jgi:thymidylate synthase (FAD)
MHEAKLVWVTPDAEKVVGYCARVSNPKNQNNPDVVGLLRYCIKHKHWSIFEMAHMCVEITTTRAISSQILRHKTASFQEFSQRYAAATTLDIPDLRRQDLKNRQNSIPDLDSELVSHFTDKIQNHFDSAIDLYYEMLDADVAKECARAVLPMNTVTKVMMAAPLRTWLHYIALRSANGTQEEHAQIARSCYKLLKQHCPNICEAFFENDPTDATAPT